jgi:heme exporter protein C
MAGKYLDFHFAFPDRSILNETIRNLFFHVPMWFTMMVLMTIAFVQSLRVLRSSDTDADRMALAAVHASLLFASLGLITGSIWARATWGDWWTTDPKLNGAAVTVLIYAAYLILRGSIPDGHKRARLAAIYNIFAYVLMLVFILVLPRLTDSLHPGNGGNPAFSSYDLDSTLRAVFYPAVTGWVLLGVWAYTLNLRVARLKDLSDEANDG